MKLFFTLTFFHLESITEVKFKNQVTLGMLTFHKVLLSLKERLIMMWLVLLLATSAIET